MQPLKRIMAAKLLIVALAGHAMGAGPSLESEVLGNGYGHSGQAGELFLVGPIYLLDPLRECPAGSQGPKNPGYRESIRFSHWGPPGCSRDECRPVHERQDACTLRSTRYEAVGYGYSVRYYVELPPGEGGGSGRVAGQEGEGPHASYGFSLTIMPDQIFTNLGFPPRPGGPGEGGVRAGPLGAGGTESGGVAMLGSWTDYKESHCATDFESTKRTEVLIERDRDGKRRAIVLMADPYFDGEMPRYTLRMVKSAELEVSGSPRSRRYRGKAFDLTASRTGRLKLTVDGRSHDVQVACTNAPL